MVKMSRNIARHYQNIFEEVMIIKFNNNCHWTSSLDWFYGWIMLRAYTLCSMSLKMSENLPEILRKFSDIHFFPENLRYHPNYEAQHTEATLRGKNESLQICKHYSNRQ